MRLPPVRITVRWTIFAVAAIAVWAAAVCQRDMQETRARWYLRNSIYYVHLNMLINYESHSQALYDFAERAEAEAGRVGREKARQATTSVSIRVGVSRSRRGSRSSSIGRSRRMPVR